MEKREPFIFSEQFFSKADEAVAGAVVSSEAADLPKSDLDSYDLLPAKPVGKLQERMFAPEVRQAISDSIGEAVASSEAAGLPRSYLHSYDELPEFLAQLGGRNKLAG
jgi:hypothetical protein